MTKVIQTDRGCKEKNLTDVRNFGFPILDTIELTAEITPKLIPPNPQQTQGIDPRLTVEKIVRIKAFQNHYLPRLADCAENEKSGYWFKRYWQDYHCSSRLNVTDGHYHSKRCKHKECLRCQRITTYKRITTYLPIIRTWDDPVFLTLTIPNVWGKDLRQTHRMIARHFRMVLDRLRKQGIKAVGTRNMETTFNPDRYANRLPPYHPHLHCIVNGKAVAQLILKYWLELYPDAREKGQDVRAFGARATDLLEAFKYSNKVINGKTTLERGIYLNALHTINKAYQGGEGGVRSFQPFGFKRSDVGATPDEVKQIETILMGSDVVSLPDGNFTFVFDGESGFFDYVDDNGECLTDYVMGEALREFLKTKIRD